MTQLLSMRGYARWRKGKGLPGQTHTAVARAIESGRLQACVVTTVDGGWPKIDADLADQEWARNTDTLQSRGPSEDEPEDTQGSLFPGAGTKVPPAPDAGGQGGPSLSRSLQVQALFRARLTQLEYEQRSGKLCNVSEVAAEAFTVGRTVRDTMLLLPDRLSPTLAKEDSEGAIHKVLTREITEILELLTGAGSGATT